MRKTFFFIAFLVSHLVFSQNSQSTELTVENFPIPVFTNSNLSLLILGTAWSNNLIAGDEIAVLDTEGNVVGNSIVLEGHNGMAVWGDDPLTKEKDGIYLSERFTIVHWSKKSNVYYSYKNFEIQTGTVTYVKDGFTIVSSMGEPEVFKRENMVSYHVKSVLSDFNVFSFYTDAKAIRSFKVSSIDGVVLEVSDSIFDQGFHSFLDSLNLPVNTYDVELFSEKKLLSKKTFSVDL